MPITKNAFARYQIIDRCLSNTGRSYTFAALLDAVNEGLALQDINSVSIRQLRGDLKFMRSEAGWSAPIETSHGKGKAPIYKYADPGFSIVKAPLNETQLRDMELAVDLLDRFKGLPNFKFLNEFIAVMKGQMHLDLADDEQKFIDWGGNDFLQGVEHLSELFRAVKNGFQIHLEYKPFNRPKVVVENANPKYLKQYNNRWFLVTVEESGRVFINPLDRIESFHVLDSSIPAAVTFDPEEHFDPIVGVTRNFGDPQLLEIKLTAESYPYIESKPIHHSQKNYPKECKVTIKVIPNKELENELKHYDLVEDWKQQIKEVKREV